MSNALSRQLAYFKDNIQTQDDQDEFDASQYYYNRDDQIISSASASTSGDSLMGTNINTTRADPGIVPALYRSMPTFSSSVNGITNTQQKIMPLTSTCGFASPPARSLPVPHVGPSNSTPYAPSSDLLAMLTKGVSLSSPVAISPDTSGGEGRHTGSVHSSRIGLVGSVTRDNRSAPFKMSDFPALDGRISSLSINNIPRDSQSSSESNSNFPSVIRNDGAVRDEIAHHSAGSLACELVVKDNDLPLRPSSSQTQQNTRVFAMQSEDFPALPGSQSHLFSESDPTEASAMHCPAAPEIFNDTSSTLKSSGNVLGMQFPLMGHTHTELPPHHLVNLHSTNDSNFLQSTEGNNSSLGPNPSSNSPVQVHHCASQGPTKLNLRHIPVDSAKAEIEVNSLVRNMHGHGTHESIAASTMDSTNIHTPTGSSLRNKSAASNSGMLPENSEIENQTKYGLLGLLDVIRMTNADLNTLALGSDLTTLGLNLNSSECLYSTFASPWAEAPTMREPQFSLPMCYYMQPPPLKTSHLSKFQLETLFYIFYAMPRDVLQAYSAQELYNREWQYHQDLKLWFKRGSAADGLSTSNNQYIFFDINSWECRLFSSLPPGNNISAGLLPEDDVRVKFTTSQ